MLVWLATTVVVAAVAWSAYQRITDPGDLPGRDDLNAVLQDPKRLFDEPGVLGSAIEQRSFEVVAACMDALGFDYRGPTSVESLDSLLDPATDGYGIATGPAVDDVEFEVQLPSGDRRDEYEVALYGGTLGNGASSGGCAEAGRRELESAQAIVSSLPYTLVQLEEDARTHPAYQASLERWRACMADAGFPYESPEAILVDLRSRLSVSGGPAAAELAVEERWIAVADADCRVFTLDRALDEVARDLGPEFVERNQAQLEGLAPREEGDPDLPHDLGSGDIQITLRWSAPVDLDLAVQDPSGATVSYTNRSVASGGELDRDANSSCGEIVDQPVENVFWPSGSAISGTYTASVSVFSACGQPAPFAYELIIQVGGQVVEWQQTTTDVGPSTVSIEVNR